MMKRKAADGAGERSVREGQPLNFAEREFRVGDATRARLGARTYQWFRDHVDPDGAPAAFRLVMATRRMNQNTCVSMSLRICHDACISSGPSKSFRRLLLPSMDAPQIISRKINFRGLNRCFSAALLWYHVEMEVTRFALGFQQVIASLAQTEINNHQTKERPMSESVLVAEQDQAAFDAAAAEGVSPCAWIPEKWDDLRRDINPRGFHRTEADTAPFVSPDSEALKEMQRRTARDRMAVCDPEASPRDDCRPSPFSDFSHTDPSAEYDQVAEVLGAMVDRLVFRANPSVHGGRPTHLDDRPRARGSVLRLRDRPGAESGVFHQGAC